MFTQTRYNYGWAMVKLQTMQVDQRSLGPQEIPKRQLRRDSCFDYDAQSNIFIGGQVATTGTNARVAIKVLKIVRGSEFTEQRGLLHSQLKLGEKK